MAKTDLIISAITKAIWNEFHNDFGDSMLISKDRVVQNIEPNSFIVNCIAPDINRDFSDMFHANFPININYFPNESNTTEINKQFYDVIERLDSIFETLEINDTLSVHGTRINKDITDENVLVYTISFNTHLIDNVEHDDTMETLEINQEVR